MNALSSVRVQPFLPRPQRPAPVAESPEVGVGLCPHPPQRAQPVALGKAEAEGLSFQPSDVLPEAAPARLVERLLDSGVASAAPVQTAAGLVPWCPMAIAARVVDTVMSKYMKARGCELDMQDGSRVRADVFSGPGHDVALVAGLGIGADGKPSVILKSNDTRIAREMVGDDYVKDGFIAGRCDKVGVDGTGIALDEISEEVGGEAVPGGYWALGAKSSPTMPHESSEGDIYTAALIKLGGSVTGDGSGAELSEAMGPVVLSPDQAWRRTLSGEVADASRVRVMYGRAFDSIGYVPELGVYVQDHPALRERFDTLGLGEVRDVRGLVAGTKVESAAERPNKSSDEARVNHGVFTSRRDRAFGDGAYVVDAMTAHAIQDGAQVTTVGKPFPLQLLHTTYDRAKVGLYYVDAERGPMVKMAPVARPVQAAKGSVLAGECAGAGSNPNLVRLDVPEVRLDRHQSATVQVQQALRDAGIEGRARALATSTAASGGQSDLYYHFYAVQVERPADDGSFVPLSDALAACRLGEGDAQTQDLLGLVAREVGWIPSLRMTVEEARIRGRGL